MSHPSDPNPTPEKLLAGVIANHFTGAHVVEEDDVQIVRLGDGLPVIECHINSLQEEAPHGAFIALDIHGGALGTPGAVVTASGYGDDMYQALVTAGCNWACAFGPVLLTAIGRADLIDTEDPDVEQFEVTLQGRRYLVTMGSIDRSVNVPLEAAKTYRQWMGGSRALTTKVLASGAIPATRGNDIIPLGCFLGVGPDLIAEVKLGSGDWAPGRAVLADGPTEPEGILMLREWALLTTCSAPSICCEAPPRIPGTRPAGSAVAPTECGSVPPASPPPSRFPRTPGGSSTRSPHPGPGPATVSTCVRSPRAGCTWRRPDADPSGRSI